MSINVKATTASLANIVVTLIGSQLSTIGTGGDETTSVFLARSKPPKPAFPYAVVDFLNIQREGYSYRDEFVDTSNDDLITEFDYTVTFYVDIHGGTADDPLGICEDLRNKLFTGQGRILIEEATTFRLKNVSDLTFQSALMSTGYEGISRITIDIAARSILSDSVTGVVEEVTVSGELFQDFDQVEPPLT